MAANIYPHDNWRRPPLHRGAQERDRPVPKRGFQHSRYGQTPDREPAEPDPHRRGFLTWLRSRMAEHDDDYRAWRRARARELDSRYFAGRRKNRTFSESDDAAATGDIGRNTRRRWRS